MYVKVELHREKGARGRERDYLPPTGSFLRELQQSELGWPKARSLLHVSCINAGAQILEPFPQPSQAH